MAAKELSSGHKALPLPPDVREAYEEAFTGVWRDVVLLEPGGWIVTKHFLDLEKEIYNFRFRPSDVLIMTYPKCGTTWMQEILWTMRNNPNLDNPDVDDALFVRSPFVEMDQLFVPGSSRDEVLKVASVLLKGFEKYVPEPDLEKGLCLQVAESHIGGRVLKTHLPFSLFPKDLLDTCKVVYVTRNVKDQVLSNEHNCRLVQPHGFVGTLDTFLQYYVDGLLLYGSYGRHMREAWQRREHRNFRLVFFEDLKRDTLGQLRNLNAFIGTNLTDQQLQNVVQQTSFKNLQEKDNMKKMDGSSINQEVATKSGHFFRKGEAGSWKGKYTPEQEAKLDAYVNEHFGGLDIDFKYQ